MKRIVSKIGLLCLLVTSLLVLDACSTSKKTTTRKGNASFIASAPDYKRIKKEINTKDSEFYYPELLRHFQAADTTLTTEQLRHLYYGAATLPDYNPYKSDKTKELNEILGGDTLTMENWKQAAEIVEQQLIDTPTHLRFHLYKQIVNTNLYGEHSQEAIDASIQTAMILNAITSTGDGLSEKTAFFVTSITDEYGMMEILGVRLKSQSLIEKHGQSYDLMEFQENKYGIDSFYFNITVCMGAMSKLFGF